MFTAKVLLPMAFFAFVLYSCGSGVPRKTNVLTPGNNTANTTAKNTNPSGSKSNQTVFVKPEQNTGTRKPEPKVYTPPPKDDTYVAADPEPVSQQFAYRSPEYFLSKTDSLQRRYSRSDYDKNMENIIKQLTTNPQDKKNPAVNADKWYAAIDFNIRKPNFVVLHHTAQDNVEQTLFTFSLRRPGRESSAHYVVARDGIVHQMLNDYVRSWHAGNGKWGNVTDMNSCSIGIEIDNNGKEPFSEAQINALIKLLDYLKDQYNIPQANFIGHSDVAPGRKEDPSRYFPWKKLADAGFGYWYDTYSMLEPPVDFNALLALRVMGYDISNQSSAIKAFKLHYIQNDTSPTLTDYDKKVLYNLYRKF